MLTSALLALVFVALAAVIIAQQYAIRAYQSDRRAAIEALDQSIAIARAISAEFPPRGKTPSGQGEHP